MKKKFKRIEWLNLYSKGFVVESINNNYNTEDIIIERKNKKTSRKKNKNLDKNITFEKVNSFPQNNNKNKGIISLDKKNKNKNQYFIDLNELIINPDDNINIVNKKEVKEKEIKKEIKKKKIKKEKENKTTININFININQNIIVKKPEKKPEKKREIKNKRKELKNKISSPLTNYLSLQTKKENKIFKPLTKKSDNKNKISNEKEIEINKDINLNLYQYMDNKNKNSRQNKRRNENNYIDYGDLGGYTFDDEIIMTESKNMDEFSEICNTMSNNLVTNDKNKAGLNMFLCGNNKYKDFKKRKVEELKHIIDDLKK